MDVRAKANHCVISMDRIGRLVLPMPIRAAMRLTDGRGELEGELNRETCELTLRPVRTRCCHCGTETELHRLGSLVLCDVCIEELKNG